MKSLSSLLLVAVAMATLSTTAVKADPEDTYRQYPERHHHQRSNGDKHSNYGNDNRDYRSNERGHNSNSMYGNDSNERHYDGRGHDSNSMYGNDSNERHHNGHGHDSNSARGNDSREPTTPATASINNM